jgi:hypothetical protein
VAEPPARAIGFIDGLVEVLVQISGSDPVEVLARDLVEVLRRRRRPQRISGLGRGRVPINGAYGLGIQCPLVRPCLGGSEMARVRGKGASSAEARPTKRLGCPIDAGVWARASAYASWRGVSLGSFVSQCLEAELSRLRFTVYCGAGGRGAPPSPAPAEGPAIAQEEPREVPVSRAG